MKGEEKGRTGAGKNLNIPQSPRKGKEIGLDGAHLPPPNTKTKNTKEKATKLRFPICKVGDEMECKFERDGSWRIVSIIAVKDTGNQSGICYYVRFKDFDKRLDEWVDKTRLRKKTGKVYTEKQKRLKELKRIRGTKRTYHDLEEEHVMTPQEAEYEQQHEELNKMRNIDRVIIGKYNLKTWYFSPYPEKYNRHGGTMFVCEYCLKYMQRGSSLRTHLDDCYLRHPPGNEIYRHDGVSIYEVDGATNKVYCQNLSLFCKLFLDHKTLYFGVSPFYFYIVCEYDKEGYHIIGFFSKEKNSPENFNLACILAFPYEQRKGWGRFLISLSYELTKREGKTGSPEKPLSDLGKKAYRSYWAHEVLKILSKKECDVTCKEISRFTGIDSHDVQETLKLLKLTGGNKKNQCVPPSKIQLVEKLLQDCEQRRIKRPPKREFIHEKLQWDPPVKQRPKRSKRKKVFH